MVTKLWQLRIFLRAVEAGINLSLKPLMTLLHFALHWGPFRKLQCHCDAQHIAVLVCHSQFLHHCIKHFSSRTKKLLHIRKLISKIFQTLEKWMSLDLFLGVNERKKLGKSNKFLNLIQDAFHRWLERKPALALEELLGILCKTFKGCGRKATFVWKALEGWNLCIFECYLENGVSWRRSASQTALHLYQISSYVTSITVLWSQ